MKNEILLFSSGLDSYFAKEYLLSQGHDVECMYWDICTKYSRHEIETIKNVDDSVCIQYDFINLKVCEHDDAFVPNRNFLLAMLTQSMYYNDCNKIWICGTKSDRVSDNNKEVFDELSSFLSKVHKRTIEITSPFWGMYKTDVISWFNKIRNFDSVKIANELLNNTFSCYYPKEKKTNEVYRIQDQIYQYNTYECMKCPACFRKSVELNSINIFRNFKNIEILQKYKNEFSKLIIQNKRSLATIDYVDLLENSPIKVL